MINNIQIPRHVVIIPDGNRRWAKLHDKKPWEGHEAGAKMIEAICNKGRDMGVQYLSFWGSSRENMTKRSLQERRGLIKIYEKYFTKLINDKSLMTDQVRINIIGQWREYFPEKLVRILNEGIEKTKYHQNYYINFFLMYSGDEEMLFAIQEIVDTFDSGAEITKETIKNHLFTRDLPPVDYLIRTGGDPHLSAGFMMWDIANAQLFFSDLLFPDFGGNEFEKTIQEYVRRSRRLGA